MGTSSYTISPTIAGVTISANGVMSIDTTSALSRTEVTISVKAGAAEGTVTSSTITLEVYDCASSVTFPA